MEEDPLSCFKRHKPPPLHSPPNQLRLLCPKSPPEYSSLSSLGFPPTFLCTMQHCKLPLNVLIVTKNHYKIYDSKEAPILIAFRVCVKSNSLCFFYIYLTVNDGTMSPLERNRWQLFYSLLHIIALMLKKKHFWLLWCSVSSKAADETVDDLSALRDSAFISSHLTSRSKRSTTFFTSFVHLNHVLWGQT